MATGEKSAGRCSFLVVSDSHGSPERITQAWRLQPAKPDGLLFLGDGLRDLFSFREAVPDAWILAVSGNCDFHRLLPDGTVAPVECTHVFAGVRLLLTHGHSFHVKGGTGPLLQEAERLQADVVLFGHTHVPLEEKQRTQKGRSVLLCNPGSIGYEGSFATLTLQDGVPLAGFGRL